MNRNIEAILFDLDGTLIPEEEANSEAFLRTSQQAADKHGVDPAQLAMLARVHARRLFRDHSSYSFSEKLGAGSAESLCADFLGDHPELHKLNQFAPDFRLRSWLNALEELGYPDLHLAQVLAVSFREIRGSYYKLYPGVEELIGRLSPRFKMGIITNGFVDLQQRKIHAAQADQYIPHHIISGQIGIGKPDPRIFEAALERLHCDPEHVLMVGNSLDHDILGAARLGIQTVLVRKDPELITSITPTFEIASTELLESVLC